MDNATYIGLSRQMVLRKEMDIIANNIANLDTTGFKVESLLHKTDAQAPAMTLQGPKPVKFVSADGVARDFGQGALRHDGRAPGVRRGVAPGGFRGLAHAGSVLVDALRAR